MTAGREISNLNLQISEELPNGFLKAEQFITILDLVCDGAEIEGFATPSKQGIPVPSTLIAPTAKNSPIIQNDDEKHYIQLSQKDIFLNGRAIRDDAGTENIRKTSLAIRVGKDNQPIMSGVNSLKRKEILTAAKVLNNGNAEANKVTGTVNKGVDVNSTPRAVIVTLTWPSLRQISSDDGASVGLGLNSGPYKGESGAVDILIRLRDKNSNTIHAGHFLINGVSVGQYSKQFRLYIPEYCYDIINNPNALDQYFPISVDVVRQDTEFRSTTFGRNPRVNRDGGGRVVHEEGQQRFTEFFFSNLESEIPQIETITNFHGSSYIGLRYSAETNRNIPQRRYLIRGIKVKIPDGTSVDLDNGRLHYPTGYQFTGSFHAIKYWTTDPAWILYALLTEDYGLRLSEDKIDKASFYVASLYCTIPVANQTTPRYSFNGVINQRKKALDVIKEIAGLMRASIFFKNGLLKIGIDKPESHTSYLFTNANVVDGLFNYSGTDKDKKFSQINVRYFNNSIQGKDQVSVRQDEVFLKYGLNQQNVEAKYTTDRNQAVRFGRSLIYSANFESELVTFECGLEAICVLEPNMIIKIADKLKETTRANGRINTITHSGNTSTITIDGDSTDTNVGQVGDEFSLLLSNGTVATASIQSIANNGKQITVTPAIQTANVGAIFSIKSGNIQHRKYRITNIVQKEQHIFVVTAINYSDDKFAYIDGDMSSFGLGRPATSLLDALDAPVIHSLKEEIITPNGIATSRIYLNFSPVNGAIKYQVSYRVNEGSPVVHEIFDNTFELNNYEIGSYNFSVRSINTLGMLSPNVSAIALEAFGLSAPPENVVNLRSQISGDNLILLWQQTTAVDVLFGGTVEISYNPKTDGTANYGEAKIIHTVGGAATEGIILNYSSGEYFVKFIDVRGNKSPEATSVVVNKLIESNDLLAAQIRENSNNYQGIKTNLVYDASIGGLRLTSGTTLDSITNFDTLAISGGTTYNTLDAVLSGITSTGTYNFQNVIDLGDIFNIYIRTHEKKQGFSTNTLFDSYTDNMDTWPNIFTTTTVFNKTADLEFQIAKSSTSTLSGSTVTATYERGLDIINGIASAVITVASNNHGLLVGDHVNFTATSQNPANGLDNSSLNRPNDTPVTAALIVKITPNTFTFRANVLSTVTGSCTYTRNDIFTTFTSSQITARTIALRVNVNNDSDYENVDIEELGVDLIFSPRTERSIDNSSATNGILSSSSSGQTTVAFNKKFFAGTSAIGGSTDKYKPVVSLNVNNMQSGDFFTIDSVNGSQFVVSIKNGTSFVAREFTYSAFGYG